MSQADLATVGFFYSSILPHTNPLSHPTHLCNVQIIKKKFDLPILTTLFPFNTEMPPFSFESKSCKGVNHAGFSKKRLPSVLPMDLNISSPSLTE